MAGDASVMSQPATVSRKAPRFRMPPKGYYLMAVILIVLGTYLIVPIVLLAINSFNITPNVIDPPEYGLANWRQAFQRPDLLEALGNTFMVFGLVTVIGMPIGVLIAWALARVRMPFSRGLEFCFWIAFMAPTISITMDCRAGWSIAVITPHSTATTATCQ